MPITLNTIRIALPSKGHLYEGSIALFKNAGYSIRRASDRQYEASVRDHPGFHVVFMRPADIAAQVREGRCHLGITGMDVYAEARADGDPSCVVISDLGFGGCRLTVAVPESWIDVAHMLDLVDLTTEFKAGGNTFRVSTKYPHLVRDYFRRWGVYYYQIVASDGALELHPSLGIADIVVDLTSSGATLKDNRLKEIEQGTVLDSAACLIGHAVTLRAGLAGGEDLLERMLDALDAVRWGEGWLQLQLVGESDDGHESQGVMNRLVALGAEMVDTQQVTTAANRRGWRTSALIRPRDFDACRDLVKQGGVQSVVAMPVSLRFEGTRPSTADRLRKQLNELNSGAAP